MRDYRSIFGYHDDANEESGRGLPAPGKRTLTMSLPPRPHHGAVQRKGGGGGDDDAAVHEAAALGTSGGGGRLPYLETLQPLFGDHDLGGIIAHTDDSARAGSERMGALAFASGNHVAFAGLPSLHTVAHEAAHVVQQRGGVQLKGGVGESGDAYERHADAVADEVMAGRSAAHLLDGFSPGGGGGGLGPVQRYTVVGDHKITTTNKLAMAKADKPKEFFATAEELAHSEALLRAMKSKVTLVDGGAAPPALDGMRKVTPAPRGERKELFDTNECIDVSDRVTNSNQTHAIYQASNGGPKTVVQQNPHTLAAINKVAEAMTRESPPTPFSMKSGQKQLDANDLAKKFSFNLGDAEVDTDSPKAASEGIKGRLPNRNLRVALLLNVLAEEYARQPEMQQDLVDRLMKLLPTMEAKATEDKDEAEVDMWEKTIRDLIKTMRAEKSAEYAKLSAADRSERAAGAGVNEFARPDVGEAYATVGSRDRDAKREEDEGAWNFHFAAVIARDGDDSVTLENFNRNVGPKGNALWYFDMQGAGKQSFHEANKDTVVDAITVRYGAPATDEDREPIYALIDQRHKGTPMALVYRMRVQQAKTRAELAALQVELGG